MQPAAAGGRCGGAVAVRGGPGAAVRRDDRGDRRRVACARGGPRSAGHALVDERAARQLSQQEKARRATFVVRNDGSEEELSASCRRFLASLEDERQDPRHDRGDRRDGAVRGGCVGSMLHSVETQPALPLSDASIIREQAAAEASRSGADRGGDLRGDEIRTASLVGGRRGADADPARPPPTTWRTCRAASPSPPATSRPERQRRLRQLLPALSARPLRRQRDARGRRLQRRPDERRQMGRAGPRERHAARRSQAIPFPETREYVRRVLAAERAYRDDYPRSWGSTSRPLREWLG